jgi:tetratricopeptide (TPR) repeat protein
MKKMFLRTGFFLSLTVLCVGNNSSTFAQTDKLPTNQEIDEIRKDFNQGIPRLKNILKKGIGFGPDRRTSTNIQNRNSFVSAWSKVSPNAAPFLGEWNGQENWLLVFPSNIRERVCVLDIAGDVVSPISSFGIGTVRNKQVTINFNNRIDIILIEDQGFLGLIEPSGIKKAWEHVYPKYIKSIPTSFQSRDLSAVVPKMKAAGCTAGLPNISNIKNDPSTSVQLLKQKGDFYLNQKNWASAIKIYTEAINFSPRYTALHYNRGLAYLDSGNKQEALNDFQESANLFLQQGNLSDYKDATSMIAQIKSSLENKN